MPGDGTDAKADEAQTDGKELPGAEGMCPRGLGSEWPLSSQVVGRVFQEALSSASPQKVMGEEG